MGEEANFAVIYRKGDWGQPVTAAKLTAVVDPRHTVLEWTQGGKPHRVTVSYRSSEWTTAKPPVVVE